MSFSLSTNFATDQTTKKAGWTKCLIISAIAASIASFNYGYNISVIDAPSEIFTKCKNGIIQEPNFLPQCVDVYGLWNLVVTIFCIGGLIGSLSSSYLISKFGRRGSLIYNSFIFIIGGLFMTFATNIFMLFLGRLFIGFSSGLGTCAVPTFLAEISPDHIRGRVSSFHQCMLVIGIIVSQGLSFPLVSPGNQSWRILFSMTSILGLIQFIGLYFIPESPVYLSSSGNISSLEYSLKRLRNSDDITEDLSRFQKGNFLSSEDHKPLSIPQLIALPYARKSLFIASFSHIAQQLSGINAYFFYSITIFSGVYLPFSLKVIPLIFGIVNALVSCSSIMLIDRSGRKSLILISTVICIMTTFGIILGFLFDITIIKMASAILFVAGFAIGLGPVPWVLIGDIFPAKAMSAGSSLSITINWICNAIVAFSTDTLCKYLGAWAFLPFLCVLSAYLFLILTYIPETKGMIPAFL